MVRVTTKIGDYVAKDTDWEPIVALKNAVEKIEERILRKLRKIEESNKKELRQKRLENWSNTTLRS
jgi:hypothetical protein